MNLINTKAEVGMYVAFPMTAHGEGLAMGVGYIESLHDETGKIRIKPVFATGRISVNKDGTYQSRQVLASMCIHVRGWNGDIR